MTRDDIKIIVSQSAFPQKIEHPDGDIYTKGLTKREYFAAMAMQGMLANTNVSYGASDAVFYTSDAVFWADKLIKALNESQP